MTIIKMPLSIVNAASGEVIENTTADWHLLPAAPGNCPECNYPHQEHEPHNRDTLFYQIKFTAEHGRIPTWADAIAHCPHDLRLLWKATLQDMGAWTEPPMNDVQPA